MGRKREELRAHSTETALFLALSGPMRGYAALIGLAVLLSRGRQQIVRGNLREQMPDDRAALKGP